jgi:hypothetical protein
MIDGDGATDALALPPLCNSFRMALPWFAYWPTGAGPFVPLALFPEQRKLRFGSGGRISAALRSISRGRRPADTGAVVDKN